MIAIPTLAGLSAMHGLVQYADGSLIAQLGTPDMRTPIAHALSWPGRRHVDVGRLDLAALGRLEFFPPDPERFPALRLVREALSAGGGAPTILNAANEVAVARFLGRRLSFLGIARVVEAVMERLGMTRDIDGDFDHPAVPLGHRLRRQVLYRLRRPVPEPPAQ